MRYAALAILLVTLAFSADKPKTPSDAQLVNVLKAEVAQQNAQNVFNNLRIQFDALQAQGKQAQDEITRTNKEYEEAVDSTARALGLDPKSYTFDRAKMVFNPNPSPAPATPSPEKK